jgi:hypothetical protein
MFLPQTDLHSQALLTAFLQSGDTSSSTSTDHTLGQATFKLTDLLKMIFDDKLFYHDPLNLNPTYIFNRGDGGDTVYDTKADNNIFRFGAGISASDITLNLGSLKLNLGGGDEIHIAGFNQNDVFNSSSIGSFEFADGSVLTTNELLARGFDFEFKFNDRVRVAANDASYTNTFMRRWA